MSGNNSPKPWTRPSGRIGRIGDQPTEGNSSSRNTGGRRIATLGDVSNNAAHPHPHPHPPSGSFDDDDDEDDGPEPQTFFAGGGERSGVSIQGPGRGGGPVPGGNLVRDLLRRAAEHGPAPEDEPPTSRAFGGGGFRLGGEDVESAYIPDANAQSQDPNTLPTAIRRLTFWRNGFTIEDGELMRYDNPEHERILTEINTGRAPPSVLNVANGQPVELRVAKHLDEDYTPPAGARIFSGAGHRLGSPVPFAHTSGPSDSAMPGSFPGSSAPAPRSDISNAQTVFEVDRTKPTTTVQLRLADGSRLAWTANLTHTIGDLRRFVNASRPENASRGYTLQTTFPTKVLDDDSKTVQEAGIGNAVVIQRWA